MHCVLSTARHCAQNSLGGNSRTSLIVCLSPSADDAPESLSTLEFGSRALRVRLKPKLNAQLVKIDIEKLQADMDMHDLPTGTTAVRLLQLEHEINALRTQTTAGSLDWECERDVLHAGMSAIYRLAQRQQHSVEQLRRMHAGLQRLVVPCLVAFQKAMDKLVFMHAKQVQRWASVRAAAQSLQARVRTLRSDCAAMRVMASTRLASACSESVAALDLGVRALTNRLLCESKARDLAETAAEAERAHACTAGSALAAAHAEVEELRAREDGSRALVAALEAKLALATQHGSAAAEAAKAVELSAATRIAAMEEELRRAQHSAAAAEAAAAATAALLEEERRARAELAAQLQREACDSDP